MHVVKFNSALIIYMYKLKHLNFCTILNFIFSYSDISIQELLRAYRKLFPEERITPKLHLLEDHTVDQLRRFRVGLGLLNEQGGELIHAEFNRIGRVVQGIQDDLDRLMAVMRRHHTSTCPEVGQSVEKKIIKFEYKK